MSKERKDSIKHGSLMLYKKRLEAVYKTAPAIEPLENYAELKHRREAKF